MIMDYEKIYTGIFQTQEYNNFHRGAFDFVLEEINKHHYKKIIDISSGRGLLLKIIQEQHPEIDLTSTDLVQFNDLDVQFISLNLTNQTDYNKITEQYELLTCLDVLEHLEESSIEGVMQFFKKIAKNFCFTIANHSDVFNGTELHLIQKEKQWWDKILSKHFEIDSSLDRTDLYSYILRRRPFPLY
jgi:2-polyprenyl-3-methyl-5-hydroxy-6-metoxy-1,4-benzoquinol methylase